MLKSMSLSCAHLWPVMLVDGRSRYQVEVEIFTFREGD